MWTRSLVLVFGAIALMGAELPAQRVRRAFSVTNATGGVAFDPAARELYVVVLSDRVQVVPVDGGTMRAVPLPPPPNSGYGTPSVADLCVDPIAGTLWLADSRGFLYEVDRAGVGTGRSLPTTPTASSPRSVAWNPADRLLYVAQSGSAQLAAFDPAGTAQGTTALAMGAATVRSIDWDPGRRQFLVAYDDQVTVGRYSIQGAMLQETSLRPIDVWPAGVSLDLRAETVFVVDDRISLATVHEVVGLWPQAPSDALVPYGSSCSLPSGATPTLFVAGPPLAGGHITIGARAPANSQVLLVWGFSPVTMNLGFLGVPACNLWTAPWVTFPLAPVRDDRSAALLGFPATLLGAHVELQAVVLSNGALAATGAATLRISP